MKGKERERHRVKFMRKLACKLVADKCRVQLVKLSPFDLFPFHFFFLFLFFTLCHSSCSDTFALVYLPPVSYLVLPFCALKSFIFIFVYTGFFSLSLSLSLSLFYERKVCRELPGCSYNPLYSKAVAGQYARARARVD